MDAGLGFLSTLFAFRLVTMSVTPCGWLVHKMPGKGDDGILPFVDHNQKLGEFTMVSQPIRLIGCMAKEKNWGILPFSFF